MYYNVTQKAPWTAICTLPLFDFTLLTSLVMWHCPLDCKQAVQHVDAPTIKPIFQTDSQLCMLTMRPQYVMA